MAAWVRQGCHTLLHQPPQSVEVYPAEGSVSSACSVGADSCTLKISQKNFGPLRQTPCKYSTSECGEKVHSGEMRGVFLGLKRRK